MKFSLQPRSMRRTFRLVASLMAMMMVTALASCNAVIDDALPECKDGLELRFIYDYNLEFADAFPSQVDCLTVLVYTEDGRYVGTYTESGEPLKSEDYRMHIDLQPGKYNIVAWGGMQCDDASFSFTAPPAQTAMEALQVKMNSGLLTSPNGPHLHNLFYGKIQAEIERSSNLEYTCYTLPMMKDTNNIRIVLENLNGKSLSDDDFEVTITDDNTLLAWNNDVVSAGMVTYWPWVTGTVEAGQIGGLPVEDAYAELTTSRLLFTHRSTAILKIRNSKTQTDILDRPLIPFLLLLKSRDFDYMEPQEFLDRCSRWNLTFFLQGNGTWMDVYIKIDDWKVRLDDIDFSD